MDLKITVWLQDQSKPPSSANVKIDVQYRYCREVEGCRQRAMSISQSRPS